MKPWILIGLVLVGSIAVLAAEVRAPAAQPVLNSAPRIEPPAARPAPAPRIAPRARSTPATAMPPVADDQHPPEETARAGAGPSREQILEPIERAFATDRVVAASAQRGHEIETQIRAVLPVGSSVRSVECRSELCRIETLHPDVAGFQRYVGDAFHAVDSKLATSPMMATVLAPPVPGEPIVAVAYVGRQGTDLPRPASGAGEPP